MSDFSSFKKSSEAIYEWLRSEYIGIRAGRATPGILNSVLVDAYNSKMPIDQVASILLTDPKTLLVTPWDKSLAPVIDKAIREANLGLSVAMDSQNIRVTFPELTSERRNILVKLVKEKLEEARIRIRTEREKCLSEIERAVKEGKMSEDEKFRLREKLQKLVAESNEKLEELAKKKEKEILE